jgi:hypothetical protein
MIYNLIRSDQLLELGCRNFANQPSAVLAGPHQRQFKDAAAFPLNSRPRCVFSLCISQPVTQRVHLNRKPNALKRPLIQMHHMP